MMVPQIYLYNILYLYLNWLEHTIFRVISYYIDIPSLRHCLIWVYGLSAYLTYRGNVHDTTDIPIEHVYVLCLQTQVYHIYKLRSRLFDWFHQPGDYLIPYNHRHYQISESSSRAEILNILTCDLLSHYHTFLKLLSSLSYHTKYI